MSGDKCDSCIWRYGLRVIGDSQKIHGIRVRLGMEAFACRHGVRVPHVAGEFHT